jgi:hypothetical protein
MTKSRYQCVCAPAQTFDERCIMHANEPTLHGRIKRELHIGQQLGWAEDLTIGHVMAAIATMDRETLLLTLGSFDHWVERARIEGNDGNPMCDCGHRLYEHGAFSCGKSSCSCKYGAVDLVSLDEMA